MQKFCKNFNCDYELVDFPHKCQLFVCKNCPAWKFVNPVNKRVFYTTADLYYHRLQYLPKPRRKKYFPYYLTF